MIFKREVFLIFSPFKIQGGFILQKCKKKNWQADPKFHLINNPEYLKHTWKWWKKLEDLKILTSKLNTSYGDLANMVIA